MEEDASTVHTGTCQRGAGAPEVYREVEGSPSRAFMGAESAMPPDSQNSVSSKLRDRLRFSYP